MGIEELGKQDTVAPHRRANTQDLSLPQEPIGGRFKVVSLLGKGGMGYVYRVRDLELNEEVALKMLSLDSLHSEESLERFRREVRLARRVTHRNVARTFDIGEHGGDKFLTMEYINGESLTSVMQREVPMDLVRGINLALQICAGLQAAHEVQVTHRDLKPDNIMIEVGGRVVITDFGIARAPQDKGAVVYTQGIALGTPAYMSPEQVEAKSIDGRSDLYALGVILYEMFTGKRPFQGSSPLAMAAARLHQAAPDIRMQRTDLPESLAALIHHCLARHKEDRPVSAEEVSKELQATKQTLEPDQTQFSVPSLSAATAIPSMVSLPSIDGLLQQSTSVEHKTLAILPFRNQGNPGDDYLAEGLHEELIDTLSLTNGLRVRARGTVMHLRGDNDPRELGKELGVTNLLEGSLRRSNDRIRLTVRLLNVYDGFQIWAKRSEHPDGDIFSIANELAGEIAAALMVTHEAQQNSLASHPVAQDYYLRGRYAYNRFDPKNILEALGFFEKALEQLPNNPLLLSMLAMAQTRAWHFNYNPLDETARRKAEDILQQARQIAPDSAETLMASALMADYNGQWEDEARYLVRALQKNPRQLDAQIYFGKLLLELGEIDKGFLHLEQAATLDPNHITPLLEKARIFHLRGDTNKGDEIFAILRARDPNNLASNLASVRCFIWRHRDNPSQILTLKNLLSGYTPELEQFFLAKLDGKTPEDHLLVYVQSLCYDEKRSLRRRLFFSQLLAEWHGFFREIDEALHLLEHAISLGLLDIFWLDHCPTFHFMRLHPTFQATRQKVVARTQSVFRAMRGA